MRPSFLKSVLYLSVLAGLGGSVHATDSTDYAAKVSEFEATLAGDETEFQRFIVFYDESAAPSTQASVDASLQDVSQLSSVPLKTVRQLATGGWLIESSTTIDLLKAQDVMRELALRAETLHAQPDYVYQAMSNDPNFPFQWSLTPVTTSLYDCIRGTCYQAGANVIAGWNYSTGNGIVIAVLDTGYTDHPDLLPNLALPNYTTHRVGYDFLSNSPRTFDQNDPAIGDPLGRDSNAHDPGDYDAVNNIHSTWHGTHTMGIAAAAYNNNLYGAGVAPNAKILPIRVLGAGGGTDSDVAEAIIWAAGGQVAGVPYNSTPARVLSLSLGAHHPCSTTPNMQTAINNARANGSVIVVAAGNDHADVSGYTPAGCTGTITVAATGYWGGVAANLDGTPYSNFGAGVALSAPGGGYIRDIETGWFSVPIYSDYNTGLFGPSAPSWTGKSGTSMATPMVSGLAAMVTALKPWLSPTQVQSNITSHARPFGNGVPGGPQMGSGLMDAGATLAAVAAIPAPAPATFTASPNPVVIPAGQTTGHYTMTWSAPGYGTVDSYASINGGGVQFTGILGTSGSLPETATFGQTITWYLYPHGHTPTGTPIKTLTVTNHH